MSNTAPVRMAVGALLPMAVVLVGAHSHAPLARTSAAAGYAPPHRAELPAGPSAAPITLEVVGRLGLGGPARAVALHGQYAYVGLGSRLEVLDVSDVARPRLVGRLVTADEVAAVAVDGEVGYLAEATGRFSVLDLSTPTQPTSIGLMEGVGWSPQQLVVQGRYVYAAADTGGLAVIDVSARSRPELVTFVGTADRAIGVALGDNCAYLADNEGGLRIIDIEDPRSPKDVGVARGVAGMMKAVAYRRGFVYAATVELSSWPWMALDLGRSRAPERDAHPLAPLPTDTRLVALDASEPMSPEVVGSTQVGYEINEWLTALEVTDTHAFVGSNSYFPGGSTGGLFIFDTTDPSAPRSVGTASHRSVAVDLAVGEDAVFAATGYGGLETIDIAQVSAPRQVGVYGSPTVPRSIAAVGSRAYVADHGYGGAFGDGRLFVLDARDLELIEPVGQVAAGSFMDPLCESGCQIATDGGLALVADSVRWIYAFDVSEPDAPALSGRVHGAVMRAAPERIALDGAHAYAAAEGAGGSIGGLYVLDVADPADPHLVGDVEGLDALDVAVADNTAYVAADTGLQLYDVGDAASPHRLQQVAMPFGATRIAVASSFAYVASDAGQLQVVDVRPAGSSRVVAQLQVGLAGAKLTDLLVEGDVLYAVHSHGVVAVDVADPADPMVAGRWVGPEGDVLSGALGEGDLFLVHSQAGHIVLRPSVAPQRTLTPTPKPTSTSTAEPTPRDAFRLYIPWATGG